VPAEFNLLDFIDRSGRAFGCPLLIEGHSNWCSFEDPYPADSLLQGTGDVPAWFVRWPELQAAVADGELTVPELASLPALIIGTASFYQESIRNDIRGSHDANEAIAALGTLLDGRVFHVELTERLHDGLHTFIHVRIDRSLPSVSIGSVSFFEFVNQIGILRPQGPGNSKIEIASSGTLNDGREFQFSVREMGVDKVSTLRHVRIEFR
jgi:hypothetical protein